MSNIYKNKRKILEDSVVPFTLQATSIRGRSVRLNRSIRTILSKHNYPSKVSYLLSEALILNCLIGQTIKMRWKLSFQVRGTGAIKLISTDYQSPAQINASAKIRGFASYDSNDIKNTNLSGIRNLGKGFFAIIIDQGRGTEPYQGITEFKGESLSNCAEHYFEQSEQLPTFFKIIVRQDQNFNFDSNYVGGGIMLQYIPKDSLIEHNEYWNRAKIFLNTIDDRELLNYEVPQEELLYRLFHQQDLKFMEYQKIVFGCSCSATKLKKTLSIYSLQELETMVNEAGYVTADCQFCGQHYSFKPENLKKQGSKF